VPVVSAPRFVRTRLAFRANRHFDKFSKGEIMQHRFIDGSLDALVK
jgi:hypothetical protein